MQAAVPSLGLSVNPSTGVLFGVPSRADAAAQPLRLTVEAADPDGATVQGVIIVVLEGGKSGTSNQDEDEERTRSVKTCAELRWPSRPNEPKVHSLQTA